MPLSCKGRYRNSEPSRGNMDDALGKLVNFFHIGRTLFIRLWGGEMKFNIRRFSYLVFSFSLTLIDSLDTLVILGNFEEFERAVKLVIKDVNFNTDVLVSVFETNIRVLG